MPSSADSWCAGVEQHQSVNIMKGHAYSGHHFGGEIVSHQFPAQRLRFNSILGTYEMHVRVVVDSAMYGIWTQEEGRATRTRSDREGGNEGERDETEMQGTSLPPRMKPDPDGRRVTTSNLFRRHRTQNDPVALVPNWCCGAPDSIDTTLLCVHAHPSYYPAYFSPFRDCSMTDRYRCICARHDEPQEY